MTINVLRNLVSNEYIAPQADLSLRNDITEVITSLRQRKGVTSDDLQNSPISELILKKTGIRTSIFTTNEGQPYQAYALSHSIREDDPISNMFKVKEKDVTKRNKAIYHDLLESYKELEAGINLKESRVSGIFSKIDTAIALDYRYLLFDSKLTPGETTAFILHELGHLFCNFLYSLETVKTNVVLAALNREDYFNSSKERKIKLLTDVGKSTNIHFEDMHNIVTLNDKLEYAVIIKNIIDSPRSEMRSSTYDLRTSEFIADQFATMHGAGGDLATALHKVYKMNGFFMKNKALEHAKQLFKCLRLFFKNLLILAVSFFFRKSLIFFLLLVMKDVLFTKTEVVLYKLYDDPLLRIRKLKEQSLMMLRDRSISKERKREILYDIETADRLIEATEEIPYYPDVLAKIFVPWIRKNDRAVKLQHDYERIVNNPLYAHSAKLDII